MALLLLGLLLSAPGFVLGPLAGLLVLSRPASLREWLWLAIAAAGAGWALQVPGTLSTAVTHSAAVLVTGAFLALTLWRPMPVFRRAVLAVTAAAAALVLWCAVYGVSWSRIQQAERAEWSAWRTAVVAQVRAQSPPQDRETRERVEELAGQMAESAPPLFPGLLALGALLGVVTACGWYDRIARRRHVGPPLGRLADFRFSDHATWALIAALALVLVPGPPALAGVGRNLLLVMLVLYALRGLGVLRHASERVPRRVVVALGVIAFFMLPFAASGLVLLGLADTWIDFRRRLAPSSPGGVDR
ncbi:MAG TPA: DUF2232 domain-containing protein [Gemmatimonadales bacterium]|nr:DUF2232 domain-containing protein [Gemmatimonadales bacterium]